MMPYETVLILRPALSDAEVSDLMEKTKAAIAKDGGELLSHEVWGRRKLIHLIGKAREGIYVYFKYKAAPALVKKLSHQFGLNGHILRQLTMTAKERPMSEKPSRPAPAPATA